MKKINERFNISHYENDSIHKKPLFCDTSCFPSNLTVSFLPHLDTIL